MVSTFKSIFTDKFLAPFTNNLGHSLSQINIRFIEICVAWNW